MVIAFSRKSTPCHARHTLIGEIEGDGVAALLQLVTGIERSLPGPGTHDPVRGAVLTAESCTTASRTLISSSTAKRTGFPNNLSVWPELATW